MNGGYVNHSFDELIGQEALKARLQVHIDSANERCAALPHVLFIGPPGCGKTSLAAIVAAELGMDFLSFICPLTPRVLRDVVSSHDGVVLLDEIHRFPPRQQENLLPLIQSNYLQLEDGRRVRNDMLTVIGATTEGDKLIRPLYDRFPIRPVFDPYSDGEMAAIVRLKAEREGLKISTKMALALGEATLGVPRNAVSLVYMIRDLKEQDPNKKMPSTEQVLEMARVTTSGLTADHTRYCEMLARVGGQAGRELLAQLVQMPVGAIEQLEIPLLMQGIIERTGQGRHLTRQGWRLVGRSRFDEVA